MARCRCGALACTCSVRAGSGVDVSGTGDADDPYVIFAPTPTPRAFQVADTPSVDMTIAGTGSGADPYIISGEAIIGALLNLVDTGDIIFTVTGTGSATDPLVVSANLRCIDCSEATVGQVPVWDSALGRYVPGPAPTSGPGSIVVAAGGGIGGAGTPTDPLRVDVCTYDELVAVCETP